MGLKRGEKVNRLAVIEIVKVTQERLYLMASNETYGAEEAAREGFPNMSGRDFVLMFCQSMDCHPKTIVNRIEFKYVD